MKRVSPLIPSVVLMLRQRIKFREYYRKAYLRCVDYTCLTQVGQYSTGEVIGITPRLHCFVHPGAAEPIDFWRIPRMWRFLGDGGHYSGSGNRHKRLSLDVQETQQIERKLDFVFIDQFFEPDLGCFGVFESPNSAVQNNVR